jgi:hypothetical protein
MAVITRSLREGGGDGGGCGNRWIAPWMGSAKASATEVTEDTEAVLSYLKQPPSEGVPEPRS